MQPSSSEPQVRPYDPQPGAHVVAPQVWQLTVPIPFPLRHVNMYALVGNDGWVLVDAGIGTPDARAAFHTGLEQAGLSLSTLQAIVLTHHHPDHVGLSGEIHAQTAVPVYMHPIDEASVQIIWSDTMRERFGRVSHFFTQHGLPPTRLWYTQEQPEARRRIIDVPPHEAFTLVEDGQYLSLAGESYKVLWTPGHSDGQICLFRERDGVFLAADHVLPRITPNIGLYSEHDRPNPLQDYLASLAKVAQLPASIALPGHGKAFSDLAARTAEIVAHHEERAQEILSLLAVRPQHAASLMEQLFSNRLKNDEARRMAVAEVLAHLEYLRLNGQLTRQPASDGTLLYSLSLLT